MGKKGAFVFRRDLRIEDNLALNKALSECDEVFAAFVFDKRQVGDKNTYRSSNALQFMCESLDSLSSQIKSSGGRLHILHGIAEEAIPSFAKAIGASCVYSNRDYTPFSISRDEKTAEACKNEGIEFIQTDDALLHPPENVRKPDGMPYTVFTPFYNNASKTQPPRPSSLASGKFSSAKAGAFPEAKISDFAPKPNPKIFVHGGREEGERLLLAALSLNDYDNSRNIPALAGTTGLSAHLKFGTISIREAYWRIRDRFGASHTLITELYWRDFFTQIVAHFPRVIGGSFRRQYDSIKWENGKKQFAAWCEGRTGFPIVDAGMRQLNATGWMHGRVRMIVSSFLAKDLHIDWRWGEKYFAQQLVDYDPALNNGNWQWSASTGCDSQPYFRVFSPWRQQEKFDPDFAYVKKWVPELSHLSIDELASLEKAPIKGVDYPAQIVQHSAEAAKTKSIYSAANKEK